MVIKGTSLKAIMIAIKTTVNIQHFHHKKSFQFLNQFVGHRSPVCGPGEGQSCQRPHPLLPRLGQGETVPRGSGYW